MPMPYVVVFLCLESSVKMRGDCSFCWYWWNWWPSLFELSFHKTFISTKIIKHTFAFSLSELAAESFFVEEGLLKT